MIKYGIIPIVITLLSGAAMAQYVEPQIPISPSISDQIRTFTVRHACFPTPLAIELLSVNEGKPTTIANNGTNGNYELWTDNRGKWVLLMVASNGYSCRIDSGDHELPSNIDSLVK